MKSIKCLAWIFLALTLSACSSSLFRMRNQEPVALSLEDRQKFDYFYQEALRQKSIGKNDAAFDLLQKAVAIDSTSAPARYELANYYLALQKPLIALNHIEGATASDSTNYWYGMMYARLLQGFNRHEEAAQAYQRMDRIFPNKPEVSYSLADVYTQLGETRKAIGALNKLQSNVGIHEPIILEKHRLYLSLKETDSAFHEIQTLIDKYPYQTEYQILLGDRYLDEGLLVQADSVYSQLEGKYPDDPYVLLSRSNYYNRVGNVPAADSLVRSAIMKEQLAVDTKVEIMKEYLKTLFRKEESLEPIDSLFSVVINQHPQAGEINNLYAMFLVTSERLEDAIEQFGYAIDKDPTNKDLWMSLIGVYLELKDYDGLLPVLDRAIPNFPDDNELYVIRGIAYTLKQENEKALEAFYEALENTNQQDVKALSDVWGQIGDILYRLKRYDESFEAYDKSLEYNPNNAMVLNNYSYYLSLLNKDLSKAEKLAGQAIKLDPTNASTLDTYAWIYFKQGDYMFAKFYIQQALNNTKEPGYEILDHYGDILYHDGDKEGAVKQWERAIEQVDKEEIRPEQKRIDLTKKKIKNKKYFAE